MVKGLAIIFLILVTPVSAAVLKLETGYGRILIPEKQGWELGKDMFGMPFIYFSPRENNQRSNISFTNTGVDLKVNLAELAKDGAGYQNLKKKWASDVQATVQGFLPYKRWQNEQGHTVHEIGFNYLHQGKSYVEKSFYIDCRGRLIFSKSLRLKENGIHDKEFTTLVRALDCGV